jgi:uncharacterized membrane protein
MKIYNLMVALPASIDPFVLRVGIEDVKRHVAILVRNLQPASTVWHVTEKRGCCMKKVTSRTVRNVIINNLFL